MFRHYTLDASSKSYKPLGYRYRTKIFANLGFTLKLVFAMISSTKGDFMSFFRDHADTCAIIGVNVGIAAILIAICLTNISSISAVNTRIDTLHVMFYDLLKQSKG